VAKITWRNSPPDDPIGAAAALMRLGERQCLRAGEVPPPHQRAELLMSRLRFTLSASRYRSAEC